MNESVRDAATDAILKALKRENAALRKNQSKLERLEAERNELQYLTSFALNRVHEAAYLLDNTGRLVYVNEAACRTLGYDNEELLRMSVWDIDPDWTPDRWSEAWSVLREQGSAVIETAHRRKDGSRVPVQINASYFAYGDREYNLALARDVTKLASTERALRDSEQAFRTLAENAPDAIVRYDRNCRRTYVNPEFARVSGVSVEKLLGEPTDVLGAAEEVAQQVQAKLKAIMESGVPDKFEVNWIRHGQPLCWYAHAVPEYDGDGVVQSVLTIWRDITERKEAEQRLCESYELLRELTSRRETAREEERKRIAREMHDELGQHLTALRMGVSTLRMRFADIDPDLAEHVEKILLLSDNSMQVLRNVVTSLRPAALDAGIAAALQWLASEFSQSSQTTCRLSVPDESLELAEERAIAIFRIVQEALTNVTRHADAQHVFISLTQEGNDCLLEVRDDGRGFDPDAIPRKSYGLAGMKERVLMLGGALDLSSSPGRGTSIKIRLPFD
jgi:PAS domain S-box-containing protein